MTAEIICYTLYSLKVFLLSVSNYLHSQTVSDSSALKLHVKTQILPDQAEQTTTFFQSGCIASSFSLCPSVRCPLFVFCVINTVWFLNTFPWMSHVDPLWYNLSLLLLANKQPIWSKHVRGLQRPLSTSHVRWQKCPQARQQVIIKLLSYEMFWWKAVAKCPVQTRTAKMKSISASFLDCGWFSFDVLSDFVWSTTDTGEKWQEMRKDKDGSNKVPQSHANRGGCSSCSVS